ncbi:MAG: hypothetical protein JXO72_11860 [Vicinamibacteria bacterium]|nr:hypothetical protein [Vicinamibacteria bacterium]
MSGASEGAILVASRARTGKILCSRRHRAAFAYLVSIGAPSERPPAGMRNAPMRLRLVFEDAQTEEEGGASRDDIERLVRFARRIDLGRGGLLVQCQAGISRSSAAAMIVLSVILGPGREDEAVQRVMDVRSEARPNRRMLAIADEILERNGSIGAAWSRFAEKTGGAGRRL